MSRRFATYGGLAALGGATYYLYSAGGDPKLAEKKAERMYLGAGLDRTQTDRYIDDAATAARRLRGDYPGQDKEAKKAGEEAYETARAKAQQYVCVE